jgi:hypothetical protein
MQGMMHLLEQALGRSQWREPFAAGPVAVDDGTAPDENQSMRKPRYLN